MRLRLAAKGLGLVLGLGAVLGSALKAEASAQSGLLVGLCGEECETLWVTAMDGTWRVVAQAKGIVVPRRSGFWRVGIARPADEMDWFRWLLWASPAREPLRIVRDAAWDEDSIRDLRRFGGVRHVSLSFVGPDHVATRETFESHGPSISYNNNFAVFALDALAHPEGTEQLWSGLPLGEVFGSEAERVFAFAAQAALRDSESQEVRSMYQDSFLEHAYSGWSVTRGRGRWVVTGSSGYGSGVARGHYYTYEVPISVPPRVVGFEEEPVPWELVAEEFPDASDVYASPAKDVLVVKVPGRLLVCPRTVEGQPGRPVASFPIPDLATTVMVQWAVGSGVARWTRELVSLLDTVPPAPRVVPASDGESGTTQD